MTFNIGERVTERWVAMPGYEGRYEVSDQGRVRSLDLVVPHNYPGSVQRKRGRMLKIGYRSGRPKVTLHDDSGNQHCYPVHKIVAAAFLGPCPAGLCVLHWDDNPDNNALSNLRYGTRNAEYMRARRRAQKGAAA